MLKKKTTVFFILFICYACFSAWVYTRGTEQRPGIQMSGQAAAGKLLWQEKNCIACHQLYGLGGYLGPDLTNIISDPSRGSAYAAAFVKSGGTTMPNYHLTDKETDDIIAYLKYVDASSKINEP
jgi:nitric oxide reductase subunit C